MDRAGQRAAALIVLRYDPHRSRVVWCGHGLLASAAPRALRGDQISFYHPADDNWQRAAERNARPFAGFEHQPAPIAFCRVVELHHCLGDTWRIQPDRCIRHMECTAFGCWSTVMEYHLQF